VEEKMNNRLYFVSLRKNAGKTSLIIGLSKLLGKKVAYAKPFGDRLLYKKKRLWDYDAALVSKSLGLEELPENITVGFEHAKLRYMYDAETTQKRLTEMFDEISKDKDYLFVEGGESFAYGSTVNLDALTVAKNTQQKLVIVASGEPDEIVDDLSFIYKHIDKSSVAGVIFNKVKDAEDFKMTHLSVVEDLGIVNLGIIPFESSLRELSVNQIAETLLAKVVAGKENLSNSVREIIVGAMSAGEDLKRRIAHKKNPILITSGDRSDIILAALEHNPSAIILTNHLLPTPNVLSQADQKGIPMLTVDTDTYRTTLEVNNMEPLLESTDEEKFNTLKSMIEANINLKTLLGE
jgi:BioD-like phosphotransacetylase family protein